MRRVCLIILCFAVLLSGCGVARTEEQRYKRVSFASETLDANLSFINSNTTVVNKTNETFSTQIPIYEITERDILREEVQKMAEQFGMPDMSEWYWTELDGNEFRGLLCEMNDPERGYFDELNLSNEDLEDLAWEYFEKIPFLQGEYQYVGIKETNTRWTMEGGERVTSVGVDFQRVLNGVRVVGDKVRLVFDRTGLAEVYVSMFNYQATGTMNMVPLAEAENRVKTPDSFSIDEQTSVANNLQVNRIEVVLVNQYSRGCTILQPVYVFSGTATMENGTQSNFNSKIIAIPESMTYEE